MKGSKTPGTKQRSIVFVLGGPGSGKGTQVGAFYIMLNQLCSEGMGNSNDSARLQVRQRVVRHALACRLHLHLNWSRSQLGCH